jgi:metal-responsive CopG/Arc/MetJ family transcriptional regulator
MQIFLFIFEDILIISRMKKNEISVTFHIDKELLKDFDEVIQKKAKSIGIPLTRKQALHLAIKETIEKWSGKK